MSRSGLGAVYFLAIGLSCNTALLASTAWNPPEVVADIGNNFGPHAVKGVMIDGSPALFYIAGDSGAGTLSVVMAERSGGQWTISTVYQGVSTSFAQYVDAVVVNNVPYVLVGRRGGDVDIFSRQNGMWQSEFNAIGAAIGNQETSGAIAVTGDKVVAAYWDTSGQDDLIIVEQTATGWTSTDPSLTQRVQSTERFLSAASVNGEANILVSATSELGAKDGGAWEFEDVSSLRVSKVDEWNGRPVIVGSNRFVGKDLIRVDYEDANGTWLSETIASGSRVDSVDMAVVNDQPLVAYFGGGSIRVAARTTSGWDIEDLAPANNLWLNAIDVFEVGDIPMVAYVQDSDRKVYLIQAVPEPATCALALAALCFVVGRRR